MRARILDNDDGTYLVVWRPTVSGVYAITISHFGITLPGVPFTVLSSTSQPCAAKCIAQGDALRVATSRVPQHFELLFKDRLGATAHATELDVFAEPLPPDSPRNRAGPKDMAKVAEEAEVCRCPMLSTCRRTASHCVGA